MRPWCQTASVSSDGHRVERLNGVDLDALWLRADSSERMAPDGSKSRGPVSTNELRTLVNYTRWLYARRGSMVEFAEYLFATGELSLFALEQLYRLADWSPHDIRYVVWDRVDKSSRCRFWLVKEEQARAADGADR